MPAIGSATFRTSDDEHPLPNALQRSSTDTPASHRVRDIRHREWDGRLDRRSAAGPRQGLSRLATLTQFFVETLLFSTVACLRPGAGCHDSLSWCEFLPMTQISAVFRCVSRMHNAARRQLSPRHRRGSLRGSECAGRGTRHRYARGCRGWRAPLLRACFGLAGAAIDAERPSIIGQSGR
jgi:hypothetical protein